MNLQNLGVQEMNAQEIRETEGGGIFTILIIVAAVTAIGSIILNNSTQNCNDDSNCTVGGSGGVATSGLPTSDQGPQDY